LSQSEKQELEAVIRRHSSAQQLVLRARIVLLANEGKNNKQIGQLSVRERLADAPRPGAPATITAEQVCQIVALACEAPAKSERPISQWTGREIAAEIKRRNIVAQISPRHASRLLKRGISSPTASATS
jgi:hypothetical protein